MPASSNIHIFGIGDHGPSLVRILQQALETFQSKAILIEVSSEAKDFCVTAFRELNEAAKAVLYFGRQTQLQFIQEQLILKVK